MRPAKLAIAMLTGILLGTSLGEASGRAFRARAPGDMGFWNASRLAAPLPLFGGRDELTVLLMGSDATGPHGRAAAGGNTDTILLARFDLRTHRTCLISIPRDTRVPIPGHATFKVNAANPYGGPRLAVRTVSGFLDVPIDRYCLVSLDGVIQAVDAVGGVDVTIPRRVDYDDWTGHLHIHLPAGRHHLDGHQVEAYIRFRHDGLGDIGRVGRQQRFIEGVAGQIFTPANLLRAPVLWEILATHARTDLSATDALRIWNCIRASEADHRLELAMLPGDARYVDGYSFWVVDRDQADRWVRRTLSGPI